MAYGRTCGGQSGVPAEQCFQSIDVARFDGLYGREKFLVHRVLGSGFGFQCLAFGVCSSALIFLIGIICVICGSGFQAATKTWELSANDADYAQEKSTLNSE